MHPTKETSASVLIKLFSVFLLALGSFGAGTFVGKQLSDSVPSSTELEIQSEEEEALQPTVKTPVQAENQTESPIQAEDKIEQEIEPPPQVQNIEEEDPQDKMLLRSNRTATITEKPATKKALVPLGISSLPPSIAKLAVGKYTLEIGSYSTKIAAKKQVKKLKKHGYTAFFSETKTGKKTQFSVSVGIFQTERKATSFRKSLRRATGINSSRIKKL